MTRGVKQPSIIFQGVLRDAREELLLAAKKAGHFEHKGIRGDERAAALGEFLKRHLPGHLGVGKGEVIDYRDRRTGQLDLIVYDRSRAAPVSAQQENLLVPAEALYAVIEVKTTLTGEEWSKCYAAAKRVRALCPFKKQFQGPRLDGRAAAAGTARCMYIVFAYSSDLGKTDWLTKEFARARASAATQKAQVSHVERVVVLDRGLIVLPASTGKLFPDGEDGLFLEFYVQFVNFLYREMPRRKAIDWQIYTRSVSPGWKKIK